MVELLKTIPIKEAAGIEANGEPSIDEDGAVAMRRDRGRCC